MANYSVVFKNCPDEVINKKRVFSLTIDKKKNKECVIEVQQNNVYSFNAVDHAPFFAAGFGIVGVSFITGIVASALLNFIKKG